MSVAATRRNLETLHQSNLSTRVIEYFCIAMTPKNHHSNIMDTVKFYMFLSWCIKEIIYIIYRLNWITFIPYYISLHTLKVKANISHTFRGHIPDAIKASTAGPTRDWRFIQPNRRPSIYHQTRNKALILNTVIVPVIYYINKVLSKQQITPPLRESQSNQDTKYTFTVLTKRKN